MKKNIGSQLALHPMPVTVIGAKTDKPVLFEFPTYEYLKTGDVLGKCLSFKGNVKE